MSSRTRMLQPHELAEMEAQQDMQERGRRLRMAAHLKEKLTDRHPETAISVRAWEEYKRTMARLAGS